jgi:hypothetical protein
MASSVFSCSDPKLLELQHNPKPYVWKARSAEILTKISLPAQRSTRPERHESCWVN